jgi:RNA polymerase sigma factor (sigma-70 family)
VTAATTTRTTTRTTTPTITTTITTTARTTARTTAELVDAARNADQGAYEELVGRYERYVWSVVRRYRLGDADAHDAVQNTWLRLVENLDRVRDPEHLGGWLATTAARECLRTLRGSERETCASDATLAERPDVRAAPEAQVVEESMAVLLWQQVDALPARGRTLLRLLLGHEPPAYAEVSRLTGMPLGSIGPTRGRYLDKLRRNLETAGLGAEAWR